MNRQQAASVVNSAEPRSQSDLQEPSWQEEEKKKNCGMIYILRKKKSQSMNTFENQPNGIQCLPMFSPEVEWNKHMKMNEI